MTYQTGCGMTEESPSLKTNTSDCVTSLAKGTFGAIPFAGPIAAEIIGHVIPNHLADRIVRVFGFDQINWDDDHKI